MAIYRGLRRFDPARRASGRCVVTVDGAELPPRNDLLNHSPDGFEWGYLGSGPAQLALAILAYELQDGERAIRLHQSFKERTVARYSRHHPWSLTSDEVRAVVAELEASDRIKRKIERGE